jgi:hypothetical protein
MEHLHLIVHDNYFAFHNEAYQYRYEIICGILQKFFQKCY